MTDQAQAPFKRSMHGFGALMITISALSPTIGVFVVGSDVIHQVGTAIFPCYVLAVLVGITIANVYGELGTAFPDSGGEYTIVGRILGPAWGFGVFGINLLGLSIANAITGLGMSQYLAVVIPGLPRVPTAIVLDIIVTAMAILSIRLNALVTGLFFAAELLALAAIAVLGFTHPHHSLAEAAFSMKTLTPSGALGPVPVVTLGAAAVSALYAFNGYGSTVFIGEELHDAPKRLARVVFMALAIGAVTELLPVLGILVGAPDLKALIASESPIAVFATAVGGPVMAKVVSLAVAAAIFNCMVVVALLCGRQLYATGRDGAWPGPINRFLSSIHPRFNSPWKATIVMGVSAMAWCFAPRPLLLIIIASGVAALYALLCIAALVGRRTGVTAHAGFHMPLGPVIPLLGLVALIGVVIATWFDPHGGKLGLLATAAVIAFFALYYIIFLRKSGWGHRGPTSAEAPAE